MTVITEGVRTTRDLRPFREADISEVVAIKEDHIGVCERIRQENWHAATATHEYETGALAMMAIERAFDGLSPGSARKRDEHQRLAALTGGTHDGGKYEGEDLLPVLNSPNDIGDEIRDWFVVAHCARGGMLYRKLRSERKDSDLFYVAFTSENHHGHPLIRRMPPPAEYATFDRQYALACGYNDVTRHCDRLQAIAFDPARAAYRAKREGVAWLSPERAYELAIGPDYQDPILDGRIIPIRLLFKEVLELPEDFELEGRGKGRVAAHS